MTRALARTASAAEEITAGLWAAITPEFVETVGWTPEWAVVSFPQAHPLLGWNLCRVTNCDRATQRAGWLCPSCEERWHSEDQPDLDEFAAVERIRKRQMRIGLCSVPGCQRPWSTRKRSLCSAHDYQRVSIKKVTLEEFVALDDVVGLPSFGPCQVVSCTRDRIGKGNYCHTHTGRWATHRRRTPAPDLDEQHWQRTQPPVAVGGEVSLFGLPDRVVAEVLFGLQQRTAQGIKTQHSILRPLVDQLRAHQISSVEDADPAELGTGSRALRNGFVTAARRLRTTPEIERHKDIWDAVVFGARGGTLRFTELSQPWLRTAAKSWAHEDLPRRRGGGASSIVQNRLNALAWLSESLRLQRADRGEVPSMLARTDITNFLNRLAYLQSEGEISSYQRINGIRNLRKMLVEMRAQGLTRQGQPLHGLPEDFALTADDVPDEPEDAEAGRDLPAEVMTHLCAHLDWLEAGTAPEVRVAVELLIDTGRRPDEICQLELDCLERDGDGKPVLVYDNLKAHRLRRRLPVAESTATLITRQQARVRQRFPDQPTHTLKLLPTTTRNPFGTKAITDGWVSQRHRDWVAGLPEITVTAPVTIDGSVVTQLLPFDKKRMVPYAYRHTYAQRHADAGVPVDVLRELMDHRQMETTQAYYRVGEQRRREAVDRVTTMQFDRHGNRVWRQAKTLLDSEHIRRGVGEVAVPYGLCSEPTNVAAGGGDCPVRFRCVGCAHFSTDVSYLPDLEAYLADLLRNRERLLASVDADAWAKAEAMPSHEEITRIRRLISRVKADLDNLTAEERAQIDDAITVVRKARNQVVGLGLPSIRQPSPDLRPERTA